MWIPIELVNYIMEYANNGVFLKYCKKNQQHIFKINSNHSKFKELFDLYNSIEFKVPYINCTQILYSIPLKRIPSITERLANIDSVNNYMSIIVTENGPCIEKNYFTSTIVTKKESSLLLF